MYQLVLSSNREAFDIKLRIMLTGNEMLAQGLLFPMSVAVSRLFYEQS